MSDVPFTLDQLRILKAIAAEGSFKRAADSLYVSQPAVSLQVQNLERQLNVPLFDRGGRRAQLTEAGHLLLSYGDKILSLCQETCRAIEDLQNREGPAAAGYGVDLAMFGYGYSSVSETNLISNTGVVASNTTGIGTGRGLLGAASYGLA